MEIRTGKLRKCDYPKAIQFAIRGMHLNQYLDDGFLLDMYGKYFLYMEMERATQIIAAYEGDKLVGILLAEIKGEERKSHFLSAL